MSNWLYEKSVAMRPIKFTEIDQCARSLLERIQPQALRRPVPVDLIPIVDSALPRVFQVQVYPVSHDELPNSEAEVRALANPVTLLIREDQWNHLLAGGPMANRARATIAHESGHIVLHVPQMRMKSLMGTLQRVERGQLLTYMDPEWQAWAFAGCLMMPPQTLKLLPDRSPGNIAAIYQVSLSFATTHLKRCLKFGLI